MASLIGAVDKAATLAVNLSVLQRKDAAVTEILGHASHVSVYIFDTAVSRWVSAIDFSSIYAAALLRAVVHDASQASLKSISETHACAACEQDRKDVEGSLFIVRRLGAPEFQVDRKSVV